MNKRLFRTAAAVAVGGLLMAAVAPLSAYAASVPDYDTTTDAPIYLMDGATYAQLTPGDQLDWNPGNGIILSANPVPADMGDYTWATFPSQADTGASNWIGFVSLPGQERTPISWKQFGDFSTVESGAWLTSVWPGYLGNGAPAAVKAAGGTYSMGIAYTDGTAVASAHVIKAYYTTITVDAGTGTWTFSGPSTPPEVTDVHTTTTLTAAPTSVDVGAKTTLAATVTAENSAPVSGNVQFYEGSNLLGTVAASNGVATKQVTIGTVGDHSYTASYVETTVGSDKFLASTSAAVTVTGVPANVTLPPNAPSENALNGDTAHGASASIDGDQVTLSVDPALNGRTVNVFAYSTPTYLGQRTVTDGKITVDVSGLPAGTHKLAIVDPSTGDVLAWAGFDKSTAAAAQSITKQITTEVASNSTPSDGEFSLTNLSGDTVTLDNPTLINGESVSSGALGAFKVTDLRVASTPGWTLQTDVDDFVMGSTTIDKAQLGIAPKVVDQAGTGATAPTMGTAQVSGSASYPWNFAELGAGNYSGVTKYDADLTFTAPAGSAAGTYSSTLTLTLTSK